MPPPNVGNVPLFERTRSRRRTSVIAPLAMAVGLGLLLLALWLAGQAWRVRRWPATPGRVERSEARYDIVARDASRRGETRTMTARRLHVRYRYSVAGQTYAGEVVSNRPSRDQAVYAEGATVSVRYDPDAPGRSTVPLPGFGGPLLIAALGAAALGLRRAAVKVSGGPPAGDRAS